MPLVAGLEDQVAGLRDQDLVTKQRADLPLEDEVYSSSRVCLCSGAASARGDIGCSTSEKPWSVSSPSIMNRTPMLPRKPACPSLGLSTFAFAAVVVSMFLLL